ncbi:MAG: peptidase S41, partial [Pseudomonadota bacterium]
VEPDLKTEDDKFSPVTVSLLEKNIVFDFASEYALKHDKIAAADQFKLTDADFADFLTFIAGKDFDYNTKTEEAYQSFIKAAEKEDYYDGLKTDLDALKSKMQHDKNQDLQKHKSEIIKVITQEIASRYYYQSGRVQASLADDDNVNRAITLLNIPEEYKKLLKVN